MGRFLLNVPLSFLVVWALMGGERGVASDFRLPPSSQSRHVTSPVLSQSEEIQELVIFPLAKHVVLAHMEPTNSPVVADVYFDERRLFIDAGLNALFLQAVEWLAAEPQWGLRIEGYCDPRGPSAYNFARADFHLANLTDYLSQLGIPSHQIFTLNYGQDPVLCRLTSEQCQEDNLRAENIFPILSIGNTQRGCLARVRLMSGGNWSRVYQASQSLPVLQRIQVASPFSSF
jgi:outer membrane protein OmpA-like peptidoglycan-associated protein